MDTLEQILAGKSTREVFLMEANNLPRETIAKLDVDAIIPDDKDRMRAQNLRFRGSTFHGSGAPWGSEASKMAKLITDPYKLVRRAKAVVAEWGNDAYDIETDVWTPFKQRLQDMGFTGDQIRKIAAYRED